MHTLNNYISKKNIALLAVFFVFSILQLDAQNIQFPPKKHPDSENWKNVFKEDLSNAIDQEGIWSFEDGILSATKDNAIFTKASYDNYVLDLEFKFGKHANSGVIVHTTDYENWIPHSVEIQIFDDHAEDSVPSKTSCGAIFGHLAPEKSTVKKPGKWNRMTIGCKGPKIYVVLNGEAITEFNMSRYKSSEVNPDGSEIFDWLSTPKADMPTKGKIGFQGKHGDADIYFRKLRIKEMN